MRVPVYERQIGINAMPGARMNAPGGADVYGAGIGAAVADTGDRLAAITRDMEDARTLELFNAFRRESTEYHEHPEKGIYATRVGFGAWNATRDADAWLGRKAGEYAKKVPGARAKQNFMRMAGQHREDMFARNSRFEADQVKKYRDAEADAAIQNGLDGIAMNYDDDEETGRIWREIDAAIELKTRGMGDEARKAVMVETGNRAALMRLSRMLENSPEEAGAWLDAHRGEFTGEGLIKAENAVNSEMKRLEAERERQDLKERKDAAYGIAEDYWNRYGKADMEARNAIYADAELTNEEKDLIWGRLEAREADVSRAERQAELDYKNGWIQRIIEKSTSYENAMDMVVESGAGGQERLQLERLAKQVWQAEKFREDIRDWAQAFEEIRAGKFESFDEILYRWGGRLKASTLQQFARMFYTGKTSMGGGGKMEYVGYSFSEAVKNAMAAMKIDQGTKDAALFVKILGDEMEQFRTQHKRDPNPVEKQAIIDRYVEAQPFATETIPGYMTRIAEAEGYERQPVYNMFGGLSGYTYVRNRGDGTFEEFSPETAYRLAAQGIEKTEEREPLPPLPPLEQGQIVKGGARRENPDGARPRVMADGTPFPTFRPARGADARIRSMPGPPRTAGAWPENGEIGLDMLGGKEARLPPNGHYGAPRDGGKRGHHGQDYSIAAGTEITVPKQLAGIKMTVSGAGYDRTSGNKLSLSGRRNGHDFRIFMCHFQDGSIAVRNGQTVTPGTVLAKVGSTGHSSGPHLHIETFIGGKRVDPRKFYQMLN